MMLNVEDTGKYTRGLRLLVQRSPQEHLALYALGPDEMEAVLAGLSRKDLDRAGVGQRTIRQIVEHVVDDDARWTMCMQVALVKPRYCYGPEGVRGMGTGPWAGSWDGADPLGSAMTLFRANRTHMLALLHHLPDTWNRYVRLTSAAQQDAQTLTVGHMVGLQATHALAHIEEIRQACRLDRC
jgi:hypothetical protein